MSRLRPLTVVALFALASLLAACCGSECIKAAPCAPKAAPAK
jgi:hypothetical protein